MKRLDMSGLQSMLAKEPIRRIRYSNDDQHGNRSRIIYDFKLEFDSHLLTFRPNNFVLINSCGCVTFYGLIGVECYEKKRNGERIVTLLCRDNPYSEEFSRYNLVLIY